MTDKEIYIFRPESHTTEELWQIVQERERFERSGLIGNCLMRTLAEKEAGKDCYSAVDMIRIANRASTHLLKHYFPFRFQKQQKQ